MLKVENLEGKLLDYWVAKAAKLSPVWESDGTIQNRQVLYVTNTPWNGADMPYNERYSPSQWWNQGGHIIEKYKIGITANAPEERHVDRNIDSKWKAKKYNFNNCIYENNQFGETPLIAAMRTFVASVFGDEVEEI